MTAPFVLWSQAETDKLRKLLMGGHHSWAAICALFPNRTSKAVNARAKLIRCKNMYCVNQALRAAERRAAEAYKPAPPKSNRPQLPANTMVPRASGGLYHGNGRVVSYE